MYIIVVESGGQSTQSTSVPVVAVLVNGGDGSLENIKLSLENQLPVVVVSGSGRAAEVLVKLHQHWRAAKRPTDWQPDDQLLTKAYVDAMSPEKNVKPEVIGYLKAICKTENIKRVSEDNFHSHIITL